MLDEPLGALDKTLRDELGQVLHVILNELRIPTIYVTHDQEEAFTVADTVAVLNFGNILQMGTPEEIYNTPASLWIASFLGFSNQVLGKVKQADPLLISSDLGEFAPLNSKQTSWQKGEDATLVLKPDMIRVSSKKEGSNLIHGAVSDSQFRGDGYRLSISIKDDGILHFRDTMRREIGQEITLEIPPAMLLVYPGNHA
jgi:ABC-type Fe3+/spermidine/putrescine transport system ATPase subunit